MPRVLEIAMQTALARRGVAVVILPGDVALRAAPVQGPRLHFPSRDPPCASPRRNSSRWPACSTKRKSLTILGGAGCAGAHAELIALAGRRKAPVVHALRGKEFIEYDNPFDVGMTGLLGFSSGYHAMMSCDTLLMLGTDFPYQQFFPKDATIIQIDLRGEQLGRRTKLDYGFVGDIGPTLRALLPRLQENGDDGTPQSFGRTLSRRAPGAGRPGHGRFRRQPDSPAIRRPRHRRTGGRRRHLLV